MRLSRSGSGGTSWVPIFARRRSIGERLASDAPGVDGFALQDSSRVAVIGAGPAGSLFSFFFLRMAETVGIEVVVDIYEPRLFTCSGPAGCNHCGGIVSESLVQMLASEGVNIPPPVLQRGIGSYVVHMDVGSVRIEPPLDEQRIAAIYRGNGPRDSPPAAVAGLDRYLQELAVSKGANVVRKLVSGVDWAHGRPLLRSPGGLSGAYDLVVVAAGVNSNFVRVVEDLGLGYRAPATVKTFICEFGFGRETVNELLGDSMHIFLLDLPRLEFAALIPKDECATLCMLGHQIDDELVERFFSAPEVRRCFPGELVPPSICHCFPRINVRGAVRPFADRVVVVGDCGVTRLYKDGIGAAYRTAKAAATTAIFHGVSAESFGRHYAPALRTIERDNAIGKFVFGLGHLAQRTRISRKAILRMTAQEQSGRSGSRPMSAVLWDLFTGSAPYRDILVRTLYPSFWARLVWNFVAANRPGATPGTTQDIRP